MNITAKTNFQRTAAWLAACGKEPGNPEHFSTQIGVDAEEWLEGMTALEIDLTPEQFKVFSLACNTIEALADSLKAGRIQARIAPGMRAEFLDALCDRSVTGDGLAFLAGFDKDGADQEVLSSNESKLQADGTPVILEGGKIGKSDQYRAPDLTHFLGTDPNTHEGTIE